ncbi:MAG: peptidoglycan DD-metalloendopeptidase family protein [Acidobacteriota bacterium]
MGSQNIPFRLLVLICVTGSLLLVSFQTVGSDSGTPLEAELILCTLEVETPPLERVERVIDRNTTLQEIFLDLGFTAGQIHDLVQDVKPVYNLNRVRAGHRLVIERSAAGDLHSFRYPIDDEEYLFVRQDAERFVATREQYDFQVVLEEFYGEVDTSLWDTLVSQGESPQLVVDLHQILQWDVDFTALQPKDSFKLIVEKKYLDGEFVKYGNISAIRFTSRARTFHAFRFENPKGVVSYYDEEGNAVRKAFLKAPFHFDPRVTSRFSHSRYHPILKTRRPHLGVDYGAATGTPVLASASGTVSFRGRDGGFGLTVKVRHPNGYVTSYAHLSRIEVKRGQKVSQGEQIGRVGATGLATGPHLDYRVQDKRGRYINPQNLLALPSDKPVAEEYLGHFTAVRDEYLQGLESIPEGAPFLNRISHAD